MILEDHRNHTHHLRHLDRHIACSEMQETVTGVWPKITIPHDVAAHRERGLELPLLVSGEEGAYLIERQHRPALDHHVQKSRAAHPVKPGEREDRPYVGVDIDGQGDVGEAVVYQFIGLHVGRVSERLPNITIVWVSAIQVGVHATGVLVDDRVDDDIGISAAQKHSREPTGRVRQIQTLVYLLLELRRTTVQVVVPGNAWCIYAV